MILIFLDSAKHSLHFNVSFIYINEVWHYSSNTCDRRCLENRTKIILNISVPNKPKVMNLKPQDS